MSSKVIMGKGCTDILIVGKTGNGKNATANTIVDTLHKESTKLHLKEESLMEYGLIIQELGRMNNDDPTKSLQILINLLSRTYQLKESIEQQDQGTRQLSVAVHLAEQLTESVIERTKDASEVLKMKEQMKQMEAEVKMLQIQLKSEEKKRKEVSRKYQEEQTGQISIQEEIIMELNKIREEMMEREAVTQKQLEKILNSYEDLKREYNKDDKKEHNRVLFSIAKKLIGPVTSLAIGWFFG